MQIKEITKENVTQCFNELYDTSAMTVQGYIPSELDLYINHFKDVCGLHDDATLYLFDGKTYNDFYGMEGDCRYPDDLHMFSIKLDDMDNCMGARALVRWFDDIVDNDKWHNEENK